MAKWNKSAVKDSGIWANLRKYEIIYEGKNAIINI